VTVEVDDERLDASRSWVRVGSDQDVIALSLSFAAGLVVAGTSQIPLAVEQWVEWAVVAGVLVLVVLASGVLGLSWVQRGNVVATSLVGCDDAEVGGEVVAVEIGAGGSVQSGKATSIWCGLGLAFSAVLCAVVRSSALSSWNSESNSRAESFSALLWGVVESVEPVSVAGVVGIGRSVDAGVQVS
jgi:hypothetical protein